MKFVLVRHSRTTVDRDVPPMEWRLSEEGVNAAVDLSKDPILKDSVAIYSSTQPKAIETAEFIGAEIGVGVEQVEGLAELTSVTNGYFDDYEGTMHRLYEREIKRINDGETLEEALERFLRTLGYLASRHADSDKAVVVSHANVLSLTTAHFSDVKAGELHTAIRMPDVAELNWDGDNSHFGRFWGQ